jgi:hypothetical protein
MTLYKCSQTASADATEDSTINWAEGQAPSSVNDSAHAMIAATAKYRDDIAGAIVTRYQHGLCRVELSGVRHARPSRRADDRAHSACHKWRDHHAESRQSWRKAHAFIAQRRTVTRYDYSGDALHRALRQQRRRVLSAAVADIFAGFVSIGARPDIGRRNTASGIAQSIKLIELRQHVANAPILVAREVRSTINQASIAAPSQLLKGPRSAGT